MIGAAIGAAGSLLGGLFGSSSSKKAMKMQIAAQREFAQHGVRWKVDDAKAAGIHPLAALGAQTHSFAPIGLPGNDMGAGIAAAGQDIGRAIDAKRSQGERPSAVVKTMQDLTVQKMGLENELLASQIARIKQPGHPPAMPGGAHLVIDGQGDTAVPSGLVKDVPLERIAANPNNVHQEPGSVVEQGMLRTPKGHAPAMSDDAKQRLEEDTIGTLQWNLRNRLLPMIDDKRFTPPYPAPTGSIWAFDPLTGEYILQPSNETPEDSLRNFAR